MYGSWICRSKVSILTHIIDSMFHGLLSSCQPQLSAFVMSLE